ncbi:alpha-amylase, partial [Candidatus Saccharibacteria bacterium]|nr:alpha-amylase [Candidatus Saccharibacteria bacterium]
MSERTIVLYLHVHQPDRLRHYNIFEIGKAHNYFDTPIEDSDSNEAVVKKVAHKSYLPTNAILLTLLDKHPEFKLSLSITGTVLEQLQTWVPEALDSFKQLVETGRVEIVGETY